MKKRIALLAAAAVCVCLTACSNNTESEKYKKYESLIDCLESNDYEGAIEKINGYYEDYKQSRRGDDANEDSSQPESSESSAETEPQEKTIELTLDNWQEYLEFRPTIGLIINTFDEFQGLGTVYWELCFKKDIDSKINTMKDNRIVAEYSCTDGYIGKYSCDINVREGYKQAACTVQGIATEEEVADSKYKDCSDKTGDGTIAPHDGGLTVAVCKIDNIESVTDNTYSFTGPAWASMKVVRIKGTVTIKE